MENHIYKIPIRIFLIPLLIKYILLGFCEFKLNFNKPWTIEKNLGGNILHAQRNVWIIRGTLIKCRTVKNQRRPRSTKQETKMHLKQNTNQPNKIRRKQWPAAKTSAARKNKRRPQIHRDRSQNDRISRKTTRDGWTKEGKKDYTQGETYRIPWEANMAVRV